MNTFKIAVLLIFCLVGPLRGSKPQELSQSAKQTADKAVQTDNVTPDAVPDAAPDAKKDAEQKKQMEVKIIFCPHTGSGDNYGHISTVYVSMSRLKKDATVSDLRNVLAARLAQKYYYKSYDDIPWEFRAAHKFSTNSQCFNFRIPDRRCGRVIKKDAPIAQYKKLEATWYDL